MGMGSYRVDPLCLDIDHRERAGPGQQTLNRLRTGRATGTLGTT